ncbi:hypothetical protein K435DRAFT_837751 [Dendrothele bispora CBS 962.96]|uniref:Uncharacterized protein n=1 Tax=Dendrothele bispora (strain CBS 962.96) TaxID=1314807 RepID=A0A4S8MA31_DENBC|nr:hypothetical protein K435DRAFT_837751 [Dendrothele bispora CBS 962.96]
MSYYMWLQSRLSSTFMDRSGSGASEDSPFASTLNTPKDEDVPHPFDQIGRKLLALDAQHTPPKTPSVFSLDPVDPPNEKQGENEECEVDNGPDESISPSLSGSSIAVTGAAAYLSFHSMPNQEGLPLSRGSSPVIPELRLPPSLSANSVFTEYLSAADIDQTALNSNGRDVSDGISSQMSSRSTISEHLTRAVSTQSISSQAAQSEGIVASVSSSSDILSSPESIYQSFSQHERTSSLYSLPNVPITVAPGEISSPVIDSPQHTDSAKNDTDSSVVQVGNLPQEIEGDTDVFISNMQDLKSQLSLTLLAKILGFLPWCIVVGATILLCPRTLETVTFSTGYVFFPRGIYRFAYWADCAIAHIMIFLACLVVLGIWSPSLGILMTAMVLGQTVLTWQDFVLDGRALGEDDRQSIYLSLKMYVKSDGEVMIRQHSSGGFFFQERKDDDKQVMEDVDKT